MMYQGTLQDFLDEFCPRLRPMIARLLACECACNALELFRTRPRVWLEASDIAYYLGQPLEKTLQTLDQLLEMRIVERHLILDYTFYGLTRDQAVLDLIEPLWLLRDEWRLHLARLTRELKLDDLRATE